ncbi:hypothetical protein MF672_036245 [Actinomadura sp. ATCC 31491]|uniref:ATP phosphoribosyltransferase regulatory subunit n=1 Tax=Actinomadura luzonensis TaxID=2805427 RepID=A0ABT0G3M7_9ACTN|nr:hypothetical protein [Actinomadura luzonensis]MCK2219206.1 hypothetical protein [Actinomadura luzonensis]
MTKRASALDRVLRQAGGPEILDVLAKRLPGADLTTLLLEVMRRRAGALAPADVLRRYGQDRFAAPSPVPFRELRRAEDAALSALPPDFEPVTLSPVAPLGTCSVLATVDQNKVVSTVRNGEVAADPTNALALEAALRRRTAGDGAGGRAEPVRLAAVQRVVRAQHVEGAARYAHFTLFALVTAGRDTGGLAFERQHAAEHLAVLADAVRACGAGEPELRVTVLDERFDAVADGLGGTPDPDRQSGRGYYTGLCFKVYARGVEVGDGGFTGWTAGLLGDRKERLLISALGLDRLAMPE